MSRSAVITSLVLGACVGPPPKEPYVEPDTTVVERVLLGTSVDIEAEAITGCRIESRVVGWHLSSKDIGLDREAKIVGCRGQEIAAKLFCRPRAMCAVDDDEVQGVGGASVRVRLEDVGSVKIMLEVNNLESGKHDTVVRRFDVAPPEAFQLQCMTPAAVWGPCAAGVAAANPLIRVFPVFGGKPAASKLLRVNGKAGSSSVAFTTGQSLEPLLGASPVVPGTYELDISLGEMHQKVPITVAP